MTRSPFLPEFIYGGTDGLVTTFAIIMGAVGAGLSANIILILGFANVLADAFSMGASNYLSAQSEKAMSGYDGAKEPLHRAYATFFSFVIVGSIPLVPFLAQYVLPAFANATALSIAFTGVAFAVIGYISGIAERKNPFATAFRNLAIGSTAALIAYGVGAFLAQIIG